MSILIKGNHLDQTVSRNSRSISGGQFLVCIKPKGNIKDLAVVSNAIILIDFKALGQVNFNFLPFVVEAGGSFCHRYFLTGIDKLNRVNFVIENHAIRSRDFLYFIAAKIQFLAGCRPVCTGGNGIHNLSLRSPKGSIQRIDVLGCGDLIYRTFQAADCKNRLIHSSGFRNRAEHFAGLGNGNGSFLGYVFPYHLNDGNAAFLRRILLYHIEIDRFRIQNIAVWSLYFNQGISGSILQCLRSDQFAVCRSIERVNGCDFRVSESHRYQLAVRVIDLETGTGIWDGVACFSVFLHNLDIAFKVGIVDEITVSLSIRIDKHIKRFHQFTAFPAGCLLDRIDPVG